MPVPLLSEDDLTAFDVDLRLGTTAVALEPETLTVTLDTAEALGDGEAGDRHRVDPRTCPVLSDFKESQNPALQTRRP